MADELIVVGDALVGQAVGQQEAAVDSLRGESIGDLAAPAQPALAKVGAASGIDPAEGIHGRPPRFRGCVGAGHYDIDAVVVDHDGEPIVVVEPGN